MKTTYKKRIFLLLIVILLVLFAALCYKKRRGIINTFFKITNLEMPYELKAALKKTYGSYDQVIRVDSNLDETLPVYENDAAVSAVETSIPAADTLVKTSSEIDVMVQQELQSGNYSFEDPLVILNPYKTSPLTALILFQTEKPCRVQITVKGKTEATDLTFESTVGSAHRIPVIGLYPSTENTVILELSDENGTLLETQEIKIRTEGLPDRLKDIIRPVTTSGSSAFPLTIISGQRTYFPFAYDCEGEIRWYLDRETANYGLYALSNGRLIFQDTTGYVTSTQKPQSTNLYEMDYLGRTHSMYYLPGGSHHEVIEKEPGGNLLALTSTLKGHFEDKIVELDRETGEIVNELELINILGKTLVTRMDWAHINTVSYQPEDDTIIISPRNLHSVIKLNWTTKEIKWILCDPRFWEGTGFEDYVLKPEGDFTYHFQQHSSYQIASDLDHNPNTVELTLFDNHQDGDSDVPYFEDAGESYSIVYSIDEKAGTVRQLKCFPVIYSKITSNTIYDEESNHIFSMCGWVPESPYKGRKGMTYEMDYETGEILNQYSFKYTFYRGMQMAIHYEDLCAPMEVDENYIKGSLRPSMKVTKSVSVPEQVLTEGISFQLIGSVLYTKALDHHIAQLIFKGENHTYVYDNTDIPQYYKEYLEHEGDIPIPLSNLEPDTYEILVVYLDTFYRTGQTFSIS